MPDRGALVTPVSTLCASRRWEERAEEQGAHGGGWKQRVTAARLSRWVDAGKIPQRLCGVNAVAAASLPDGRVLIAAVGYDSMVWLWNPVTGTRIGGPLTGHENAVFAMAAVPLSDDHTLIATGGTDGTVRLWDPITCTQVGDPLTGHKGWIGAVVAVPFPVGRTLVASGSTRDKVLRFWDPITGIPLGGLNNKSPISKIAAVPLPDGRVLICTGGSEGTVQLWDPLTCAAVGEPLISPDSRGYAMAVVPLTDGQTLIATSGGRRGGAVVGSSGRHPGRFTPDRPHRPGV